MNTTKILAKLSLATVGATMFSLATTGMAQAATIIVNFDDLTGSNSVPDGYGGIIWDNNFLYYDWDQDPYNPSSTPTRVYGNYGKYPVFDTTPIPFKFLSPVIFDGAYFSGSAPQSPSISFSLYKDGSFLANSSSLTPSNISTFLSSGYSGLVDEVRVNWYNGYAVMDDVTYRTVAQSVPEPASMLGLLTVGSLGLGSLKRKQKA